MAARRQRLEQRVIQQRLEMLEATREWYSAMAPVDRGWQKLSYYRGPLLLGSGMAITAVSRRPRRIGRWLKRGIVIYTLARRARTLMRR